MAVDSSLLSLLSVDPFDSLGQNTTVSSRFTMVWRYLVLLVCALVQILVEVGPVSDNYLR